MNPKEARKTLCKIARSGKYKVVPGIDAKNFYRFLDQVYEHITKDTTLRGQRQRCDPKVISFFFDETDFKDNIHVKIPGLPHGENLVDTAMSKGLTLDDVISKIEKIS